MMTVLLLCLAYKWAQRSLQINKTLLQIAVHIFSYDTIKGPKIKILLHITYTDLLISDLHAFIYAINLKQQDTNIPAQIKMKLTEEEYHFSLLQLKIFGSILKGKNICFLAERRLKIHGEATTRG